MTHQNLSLGMCWKLFYATLNGVFNLKERGNSLLYGLQQKIRSCWFIAELCLL